jgi:hypothetical protein
MANPFYEPDEIAKLTGRAQKSRQIEALRKMCIPFFVNDVGKPIVARSAVEGRKEAAPPSVKKKWQPRD